MQSYNQKSAIYKIITASALATVNNFRIRFILLMPNCYMTNYIYPTTITKMQSITSFFSISKKAVHCHCVKSVHIRSYSGPLFLAFRLNTERYSKTSSQMFNKILNTPLLITLVFTWKNHLRDHSFNVCNIFRNTNISYPLIHRSTCAYQGVREMLVFRKFCAHTKFTDTNWNLYCCFDHLFFSWNID